MYASLDNTRGVSSAADGFGRFLLETSDIDMVAVAFLRLVVNDEGIYSI